VIRFAVSWKFGTVGSRVAVSPAPTFSGRRMAGIIGAFPQGESAD
jgi:hypothetical protein